MYEADGTACTLQINSSRIFTHTSKYGVLSSLACVDLVGE